MSQRNMGTTLAMVILSLFSAAANAEIIWQPPWMENPSDPQWQGGSVTHQVWEFAEHPIIPAVVENPFGGSLGGPSVYADPTQASYPDVVIGPDGETPIPTIHIDVDGGILGIYVPNDPRPNARKVIFIQLTSDKGPLLGWPSSSPAGTVSYPKPAINHDGTGWYTYTAQIDIPFNPPEEWITYAFPASTNISELVVDTICVPEPATMGVLALAGLALIRPRNVSRKTGS